MTNCRAFRFLPSCNFLSPLSPFLLFPDSEVHLHIQLFTLFYSRNSSLQQHLKMKENATALYPDQETGEVVSNYAYEHSTNLPRYLLEMHAEIKDREDSFYMISPLRSEERRVGKECPV